MITLNPFADWFLGNFQFRRSVSSTKGKWWAFQERGRKFPYTPKKIKWDGVCRDSIHVPLLPIVKKRKGPTLSTHTHTHRADPTPLDCMGPFSPCGHLPIQKGWDPHNIFQFKNTINENTWQSLYQNLPFPRPYKKKWVRERERKKKRENTWPRLDQTE